MHAQALLSANTQAQAYLHAVAKELQQITFAWKVQQWQKGRMPQAWRLNACKPANEQLV